MKDPQLWQSINDFQLDDNEATFTFSQRLARDNKWSHAFSLEAIDEYKKFMYLCCIGKGEVTPSDEVDQVWHLHLTYTKSYWIDFCQNTLRKQIHHNPTKGGGQEAARYSNCYDSVFEIYKTEFGINPPLKFWPNNEQRFTNINFKRVNLSDYWLIQKPNWRSSVFVVPALIMIAFLFIRSESGPPWIAVIVVVVAILFLARGIKGGGGKRGKGGGDSSGGGFWDGFWGCSSDHSGCSSHGCSSGCGGGSGCSGCSS